jgi:hypothetical protein
LGLSQSRLHQAFIGRLHPSARETDLSLMVLHVHGPHSDNHLGITIPPAQGKQDGRFPEVLPRDDPPLVGSQQGTDIILQGLLTTKKLLDSGILHGCFYYHKDLAMNRLDRMRSCRILYYA